MFRKFLPILILNFLVFGSLCAQQKIRLKGVVTDAQTGEGVAFAHVGSCDKPIGAVAGDDGKFDLSLSVLFRNDSLCVSSIGYKTVKFPINELLKEKDDLVLALSPNVTELDELVIHGSKISGRRVIRDAVKAIKKNFPKKPFVEKGYYRDYLKKDGEYVSLLEGAFIVEDPGFKKRIKKGKVYVEQIRYSEEYLKNYEKYVKDVENDSLRHLVYGISPFVDGNELASLLGNNPVRNHKSSLAFIGVLDSMWRKKSLEFEIDHYTYLGEDEVYVVKVSPTRAYQHVDVKGEFYIRVKDFAFVRMDFEFYVHKVFDKLRKWYEVSLEYQDVDGKMYLKYLSFINYFKLIVDNQYAELQQYREFFVNDVIPEGMYVPGSFSKEGLLDPEKPLFDQGFRNDPDFWKKYNNSILETPLVE
ncbi:hypothetical protein FUAX_16480 [Fulvitalea axinellae]|uniref:Carboxypeptidase-like regulatory domain-containing protein n=1 Tax=Fulvitalea axinellae TaxID=1182444 RepID=A0AAU9CAM9_9BACT|nr:hypothetical protein FUAX_16480 [Fulvitalea axinellae]